MTQAHHTKIKFVLAMIAGVAAIVVSYRAVSAQTSAVQTRSVWDGVYTDAQAARGAQFYTSDCASCHGNRLEGKDDAPSLAGKEFMDSWDGRTLGSLLAQMRKMPRDAPGRLSAAEYADSMAYILSVNKFPAGKTDLPQEIEVLRQIRLEAAKPAPKK
jgi:mono/diheme cytochrome c family protein